MSGVSDDIGNSIPNRALLVSDDGVATSAKYHDIERDTKDTSGDQNDKDL